jgi:RNA polymerase sigma-70 factor (ECF subfamily)
LTDAWNQFYDFCNPMIARAVGVHRLSEADRNDCVQEVWGEIIARLVHFQYDPARGRLRTWISTLMRNKVVDLIRRRARQRQGALSDAVQASLVGLNTDPAVVLEQRTTQDLVWEALDELARSVSNRSYRVLHLRWFEGRTVPEIADTLGLTPNQVRFRHHRVKRKLFHLMEKSRARITLGERMGGTAAAARRKTIESAQRFHGDGE